MKKVWLLFSQYDVPASGLDFGDHHEQFVSSFSTLNKAEKARDEQNEENGFRIKETGETLEYFIIESEVQ